MERKHRVVSCPDPMDALIERYARKRGTTPEKAIEQMIAAFLDGELSPDAAIVVQRRLHDAAEREAARRGITPEELIGQYLEQFTPESIEEARHLAVTVEGKVFRLSIPDESGAVRQRFDEALKRSGMTRPGFAYKVVERGLMGSGQQPDAERIAISAKAAAAARRFAAERGMSIEGVVSRATLYYISEAERLLH